MTVYTYSTRTWEIEPGLHEILVSKSQRKRRAEELTQQLRTLAAPPEDPSSVLSTYKAVQHTPVTAVPVSRGLMLSIGLRRQQAQKHHT